MAVFGPKLQFLKLRSATCDTHSRPPPLSFWLKLCVVVPHTHRYHPPKFQPNVKHHDGCPIFPHFARAACCCLLLVAAAAKPGRSTLDPKKGYKTKTGSTSSVTVAHGLGSFLRKVIFLPLLDPVDPFGHPPVWASACSLPQPSGPRHWGLGVPLGNSEGWKPQKVGGCGWNRCPRNRILSHVAKDMAYSWFVAVGIWSFWGPF